MEDLTEQNSLIKKNQRLKKLLVKYQHTRAQQDALIQLSEKASTVTELTLLYPAIHQILESYLPSKNFYVVLLNEQSHHLELNYFSDEKDSKLLPLVEDNHFNHGLTGYVFNTGKTQLYNKEQMLLDAEKGKFNIQGSLAEHWLGVPVYKDKHIIGVMVTQSYQSELIYSKAQVDLLEMISLYLATAIQRVKKRELLELEIKFRTNELKYSNERLEHRVAEKTYELRRANLHLKLQIEERKKVEKQLYHDAHHDTLTGLANRNLFMMQLQKSLQQYLRHKDLSFAVLFIDLDNFKAINDNFGHQAGDQFLIEIATSLKLCIRDHDVLARVGGDEFVVLLTHVQHPQEAREVAKRIINSVKQPFCMNGQCIHSGASIGISFSHSHYQHIDDIVKDADEAMYHAKQTGKGKFKFYHPNLNAHQDALVEKDQLEINASDTFFKAKAIENNRKKHITAYLIEQYWHHPTLGEVDFTQFQSTLNSEQISQILTLTHLNKIQHHFTHKQQLLLSISTAVLSHNHFNTLKKQLSQFSVDVNLCLVFQEKGLRDLTSKQAANLKQLKTMNIKIGINNFAQIQCELNLITQYQFDFILLSPVFSKRILQDISYQLQIQGLLAITKLMNSQVIANGPSIFNFHNLLEKQGINLFCTHQSIEMTAQNNTLSYSACTS